MNCFLRFIANAMLMLTGPQRLWVLLLLFLQLSLSSRALIPTEATADPLYAKGYLVVTYYAGVSKYETNAPQTRAGIQQAIDDAFANRLVVYFPEGTYLIDNKLNCHSDDPDQTVLRIAQSHHALVGSTKGASPKIKLLAGASGYNTATPKAMVEFKNFDPDSGYEHSISGYYSMFRGIDLDCNGNTGAYGIYFDMAQDCSLENVKVTANGGYAGIRGLPMSGWGAVNVEVEGGKYGIDLGGLSNGGTTIVGAVLKGQTENAIRFDGFSPLTVVGFEIVTKTGSTLPAITVPGGSQHYNSSMSLIDGSITCTTSPSNAAIVNTSNAGQNLYIRNVSVKGTDKLIQSGTAPKVMGSGLWKRIDEYSYCDQSPKDGQNRISRNMIDGSITTTAQPIAVPVTNNTDPPDWDLVLRHTWASLPSVDDTDYVDGASLGIVPGNVSSTTFQNAINNNRKIFLRPGIYMVNSPGITLRPDTVLFGAARHLTRIEPRTTWLPTTEIPVVSTLSEANATTYLGDLCIGVNTNTLANSVFCALDWKAGASSMVYTGRPYRFPEKGGSNGGSRSLLRIRNSGGGRWYFAGCGEGTRTANSAYRHLKVEGTRQPLWMYGLNLEHARGDIYAEFSDVQNVRVFGVKTEYEGIGTTEIYCPLISFANSLNVGLFGHGAIRHSAGSGRGNIEVLGTSDRILATLIAPQNGGGPAGYTILDAGRTPPGVTYPDCVSLFKRGAITTDDETKMKHAHIGYASLPSQWKSEDVGTGQLKGSAGFGSGIYTVRGSGNDIFNSADTFHYVYQTVDRDCEITARVLTQQVVGSFPKAGLMIRETTGTGSKFAHWLIQKAASGTGAGVRFQYRATADTPAVTLNTASGAEVAPYWLKLKRKGNVFRFSKSVDGQNWTEVGERTIEMGNSVKIGMAVCSNDMAALNAATFDHVVVNDLPQTAARSWQQY